MKLCDIFRQGVKNLFRHRGRTMLTVLGVIVGCCSIVIMISIGIGMRLSTEATLAQMGDLNIITVEYADAESGMKLDDTAVQLISAVQNVKAVIPKLQLNEYASLYAGTDKRYAIDYVSVIGEDPKSAELEGYELVQGDYDSLKKGEALAGQYLVYAFSDTKRPEGYNQIYRYDYYNWEADTYTDLPDPYVDLSKETLTLMIGDPFSEGEGKSASIELKIGGVFREDWNKGYETSEGLMIDIDTLKSLINEYASATGTKKKEITYSEIRVIADDIRHVESIEKEIRKMGFRTSSMESIRKPMEQDMQQKQMLLGCVGAVSLFVAALGIANTMIMAITERIHEIGVMKALGCFLKDIRKMFLLEAGCIGLMGGMIGIGFSYLISMIMNAAGSGSLFGNEYDYLIDTSSMDLSVIPWWLAVFAVLFSVLVGVTAGLYPAEKAVRISVLEAIRHD